MEAHVEVVCEGNVVNAHTELHLRDRVHELKQQHAESAALPFKAGRCRHLPARTGAGKKNSAAVFVVEFEPYSETFLKELKVIEISPEISAIPGPSVY